MSAIFLRRYISGNEPIPYEEYFGYAGIAVEKKLDASKSWSGIETAKNEGDDRAKIRNIIPGSPAETAGLESDDIIYAVDNHAMDSDAFTKELAARKPADTVKITVLRLGEFKEFPVTLVANPYPTYTLKPMEHPTDQQKAIYDSWLRIKP